MWKSVSQTLKEAKKNHSADLGFGRFHSRRTNPAKVKACLEESWLRQWVPHLKEKEGE